MEFPTDSTNSITLAGEEFIWDGERWYNKRTFQAPRPAQAIELRKALAKKLENSTADGEEATSAGA